MKNPLFIIRSIIAVLLSGIMLLTININTVIGKTPGTPIEATRRDYKFDNDKLLIGGYNFDLRHTDEAHVSYINEAGIDFMITSVNENFLNLCDKYGIGVIAKGYNGLPSFYWETKGNTTWLDMTNQTMLNAHECIWGNDLIDEPVAREFPALGKMVDSYYSKTNGLLPLINLFPLYASSEQLGNDSGLSKLTSSVFYGFGPLNGYIKQYNMHVSDYINNIDTDYISVDIYPLGNQKTTDTWLRNLDILAEACRKTNRDLWVIIQTAGENTDKTNDNRRFVDAKDIRWQSYVSMSYGAKSIIHACYDSGWWDRNSHMIDANGNRTETYYAAQEVNNELHKIATLYGEYENQGAYLVNSFSAAGVFGFPGFIPVENKYKPVVASADPILVGCFTKDATKKAYTFVNMNEPLEGKDAKASVTFDGADFITLYRGGEPTVIMGNTLNLSLAVGEGVFVTVN